MMSSGAMTVVHGNLHILDDGVIVNLVAIGKTQNHGGTGIYLTETLRTIATQHMLQHHTTLALHFVQEAL